MADDVARKLNAINNDYNARTIPVYLKEGSYTFSNIERNVVQEEVSESEKDDNTNDSQKDTIDITKIFGNHSVVLMDVPKQDITLVVDPTNVGIGIFQNGKITMFNSGKENPAELKMKPLSAPIWGMDDLIEIPNNYINSLGTKDIEELKELWGVEAQDKALDEVRDEFKTKKERFNESIKYDVASSTVNVNINDNEKDKNKEIESER